MTNPFQSIIGTLQNPPGHQDERDERKSFADALAEDIRADELGTVSVSVKEPPFGIREPSARIETGLCAPREASEATVVPALPKQERKPLRGGTTVQTKCWRY